jgi:hypothetical protein
MDYDRKVAVSRSIWLSDWRPLAAALAIGSFWLLIYVDNRTSTLDPVINFLSPIIYIGVVICAPMISLWGAVRALIALIRVRPKPGSSLVFPRGQHRHLIRLVLHGRQFFCGPLSLRLRRSQKERR